MAFFDGGNPLRRMVMSTVATRVREVKRETSKHECPTCGAYSFEGACCEPQCELGSMHRKGLEEVPIGKDFCRMAQGASDWAD
jgi:hypothetical protein